MYKNELHWKKEEEKTKQRLSCICIFVSSSKQKKKHWRIRSCCFLLAYLSCLYEERSLKRIAVRVSVCLCVLVRKCVADARAFNIPLTVPKHQMYEYYVFSIVFFFKFSMEYRIWYKYTTTTEIMHAINSQYTENPMRDAVGCQIDIGVGQIRSIGIWILPIWPEVITPFHIPFGIVWTQRYQFGFSFFFFPFFFLVHHFHCSSVIVAVQCWRTSGRKFSLFSNFFFVNGWLVLPDRWKMALSRRIDSILFDVIAYVASLSQVWEPKKICDFFCHQFPLRHIFVSLLLHCCLQFFIFLKKIFFIRFLRKKKMKKKIGPKKRFLENCTLESYI